MMPVLLTVNGTGTSVVAVMDFMQNPFNVGIGVLSTGVLASTAWRLEHTFFDFNPATANVANAVWFVNSQIGTSSSTTANSTAAMLDMNYAFPVRGIRLSVMTAVATSVVQATIVQASNAP